MQVLRLDGTLIENIPVLTDNWQARRIAGSDDISGNQFEEIGVLATRHSDDTVEIQLKDSATEATIGNIFP